jgi:hypothetical protein
MCSYCHADRRRADCSQLASWGPGPEAWRARGAAGDCQQAAGEAASAVPCVEPRRSACAEAADGGCGLADSRESRMLAVGWAAPLRQRAHSSGHLLASFRAQLRSADCGCVAARSCSRQGRETDRPGDKLRPVLVLGLRCWAKKYRGHVRLLGQRLGPGP